MNIVACPKCAAQFDVSEFQPGSPFVCGSCGNALTVPGPQAPQRPVAPKAPAARRPAAPQRPAAPAARRPATGRPAPGRAGAPARPAAPGRAGGAKRVDPRRAGGAAPAAPAAPPGRATGGRRAAGGARRGGYEKPEKSNLPLVLGGVGAVVVIVVIIAVLAFTGNGNDPVIDRGPDVADNGGPVEPAGPTKAERRKKLSMKVVKWGKDPVQLHAIFQECETEFPDVAKLAAISALKEDEDLEWANKAVGKMDLEVVYGKLPDEEDLSWTYQNDALRELEDAMLDNRWVTSEKYASAERMLREVLDHAQKLRGDQKYVDIWQIRSNVAGHVFYKEFPYSVKSNYPYVVFVQSEDDGQAKGAISNELVDRNVRILKRLYEEFHRVFGKRFDLPRLENRVIPSERTLKVFTLASEKKFHEYQRKIGQPLPGGVRAYYKPSDQWITLFEGGKWEKSAKKGESSFNINKIFHEGTHQLVHVYTKILMQRAKHPEDPDGKKDPVKFAMDEVPWTGKGVHSEQHWFQEGFAELFAASKPTGDSWELLQMHRNRLQEWKNCRKGKKDDWPFEVLVKVSTRGDMQRKAFEIGLNRMEVGRLGSLFYAQAWVFCHYLWFGEDGAHREKFLEYMGSELTGKTGYRYWKKVWGNEDWKSLGEKVDQHFDKLCKEMGVK